MTHERRNFPTKVKLAAFERCAGRCENCSARLVPGKFAYDHQHADALGGEPTADNCAVLCVSCHMPKTATDAAKIAKVRRIRLGRAGIRKPTSFPCGRGSKFKRKLDGTVVLR